MSAMSDNGNSDSGSNSDNSGADAHGRRFFGRRKGHQLKRHQGELMETLLPQLAVDLATPKDPAALFPAAGRIENLWLEIGFGGGEHLAAHALARPDTGFVGCEPFLNGMAKALALVETHALKNVRLHFGDAMDLLRWLPDASLSGVDLLYPDPWPKVRHWKRRFVQDDSVAEIARVLKPGTVFRVATDIPHYAAWTLERVLRAPDLVWTAERADDWRLSWAGWTQTRYEAKALREGRTPAYFIFRRR
jgi:tRNA (guanine-N7-)-methyltransferase